MDFGLSEEQAMLKEALERLLAAAYDFETRRRLSREPRGWSSDVWTSFAELGLLAAPFAEADGGLGFGAVEGLVVAEALGARLSAEPYLATVVMAGAALRLGDNAELRAKVVPQIAAGELIIACAPEQTLAGSETGDGWRLEGMLRNVVHADTAQQVVVFGGSAAFLVDADAPGLSRRGHRTFDGLRAAELSFDGVTVDASRVLARGPAATALAERVRQHAIAHLASEAVGLMQMLLDATVEHLKTRKQFGQTLGKFQALQHRCAEMAVALEQARSIAIFAATSLEEPDTLERRRAFAAVKAVIGGACRFVGQNAVQLHGGVGVTEEHRAGWGLRRLTMIDLLFGDAETHAAELARLGGYVDAG